MITKVWIHKHSVKLGHMTWRWLALGLLLCALTVAGAEMAMSVSARELDQKPAIDQSKTDEKAEATNQKDIEGIASEGIQDDSPNPILILVEGENYTSREMIEALRREYANQTTKSTRLDFTLNPSFPYDLRLIVSRGSREETEGAGADSVTISISHTTVVGLDCDGKLRFIETYADSDPKKLFDQMAILVRKDLYRMDGTIIDAFIPASVRHMVSGSSEEPPKAPGVYLKDGSNWILMSETLSKLKTRSVSTLLTFGLAPSHDFDVFSGSSAKLQIANGKPEFFVRGFDVSESVVAILELKKDIDKRVIQSGSHSILHNSEGYENTRKFVVTPISDGLYKMTPAKDLGEGEYALDLNVSDESSGVYDFGISKHKKE